MNKLLVLIAILLFLGGCTSHVQLSSGEDYLSKYPKQENIRSGTNIDDLVAKAAAIEPNLSFPAKIGLVRIYKGKISSIPQSEVDAWLKLSKKLGSQYGEFIPVSPLIAELAASAVGLQTSNKPNLKDLIAKIRIGAARQHLDVVLMYEVFGEAQSNANALAILDLTIIGGFISPGHNVKAKGTAQALLVDVRNGYPYGTASIFVEKEELTAGYYTYGKTRNMQERTAGIAAIKLVPEVERMLQNLLAELTAKK